MSVTTGDIRLGMSHQLRLGWRTSRPFAISAMAITAVLHLLAILTAIRHDSVAAAGITSASLVPLAAGLWSALALLPALGGGDSDDPLAVAAVGAGRSFTFGSRLAAALTDAGPGLFVPLLAIIGAAASGWPGWIAGLALAWSGVAVGQLAGASSAILMRKVGPTWALLIVAGLVLAVASFVVSSGLGPGRWLEMAVTSPAYIVPIFLTGVLALWGAWALNRPNDRSLRAPRSVHLPHPPGVAVWVVMTVGIGRSVAARSTVITAALAPILVRGAGTDATTAIVFFVMAAAAAVLGANGFAYDGGSAVWLLGKVSHRALVLARLAATGGWTLVLAVVASVSGLLVGAPVSASAVPALLLVAVATGAAGLVPSIKRPMSTDFDSFRTQTAPVVSAMGTLARSSALTVGALVLPLWASLAVIALYAILAVVHSLRLLRDPVALAGLA
jgi:hypothetical protein